MITFFDQQIPDLPGEDGRILAFVALDFGHHKRCGHFRFTRGDVHHRCDRLVYRRFAVSSVRKDAVESRLN